MNTLDLDAYRSVVRAQPTAVMVTGARTSGRLRGRIVHPLWASDTPSFRILTDGRTGKALDVAHDPQAVISYQSSNAHLVMRVATEIVTGAPVDELRSDLASSTYGYEPDDFWTADEQQHLVVIACDATSINLTRFDPGLNETSWTKP